MIETVLTLIRGVMSLHPVILIVLVLILLFVALKVFKFLMQIVITGIAFGLFPVVAYLLGFDVPLTLNSIMGSVVFGIVIYFIYHSVRMGYKIIKIVLSPFRKLFREKPKKKVIVKEKEKEK